MLLILLALTIGGCNKSHTVAECRLDVARKWSVEVLSLCAEPGSLFSTIAPQTAQCSEVDEAAKFMRLCMQTAGYRLAPHCSTTRFGKFDRKCYTPMWPYQWLDAIAESDLLSDSSKHPWTGYAWNKGKKRLEWMLTAWESHDECMHGLKEITTEGMNALWYSEPIGCAYSGNSYWRVWLMNALFGGSELGCIAESGQPKEAAEIGMLYGAVLGKDSPRTHGDKWRCM